MTAPSVVTLAWTDGAEGEAIAGSVASTLGYRLLNHEIIERAAESAGVDPSAIESVEHRESFMAHLMRLLTHVQSPELGPVNTAMYDQTPAYRAMIKDVVRKAADEGSVVIGLHGAGIVLAGRPGTVRVFVTASKETRVRRVVKSASLTAKDAQAVVEKTDADRREFFQTFFEISEERPTHYDLVVNTDNVSVAGATRAILAASGDA